MNLQNNKWQFNPYIMKYYSRTCEAEHWIEISRNGIIFRYFDSFFFNLFSRNVSNEYTSVLKYQIAATKKKQRTDIFSRNLFRFSWHDFILNCVNSIIESNKLYAILSEDPRFTRHIGEFDINRISTIHWFGHYKIILLFRCSLV